jgi:broad specificity phosphatase PhoE
MSTPGDAAHSNAATRLVLICHAPTSATRGTAFADDEPLERVMPAGGVDLGRIGQVRCGPELRCRQTATGLGWQPAIDPALADLDVGRWRGRALTDVRDGLEAWLTDPAAAPHGGESVQDLLIRVGEWLTSVRNTGGRIVAVTHAAVVRAAVVTVLGAGPMAFWRIDAAPLSQTLINAHGGRWTLRETGHPLVLTEKGNQSPY